jgi:hypothetical protein
MQHRSSPTPAEIEAELHLKRSFLRAALAVSGGSKSSPEATRVAGNEAAKLKAEIMALEARLHPQAA